MRIQEIYERYQIMPSLQLHMLRVAAVTQILLENLKTEIVEETQYAIITAALLHDMGNIIKSDLSLFPEFVQPEGEEYWQNVQKNYFSKYGSDEHQATITICQEIGVQPEVIELIDSIGVPQMRSSLKEAHKPNLIVCYADMRVAPYGVVSLEDRVADGKIRWQKRHQNAIKNSIYEDITPLYIQAATLLFSESTYEPATITDEMAANRLNTLRDWEVKTPTHI